MKGRQTACKSEGQIIMTNDDFWATPTSMWLKPRCTKDFEEVGDGQTGT